jgi:hypothetical protein
MGEMRIMDKDAGDLRVIWDSSKQVEVDAAKKQFEELMKKKYKAFAVKSNGEKGEEIKEFNPYLEKVVLAPAPAPGCFARIMAPPAP